MTAYTFLQPGLRDTADSVRSYLSTEWGVTGIKTEAEIDPQVSLKPTLSGRAAGGFVCVEVSESFYPGTLDAFVTDCVMHGIPAKLYVACPSSNTGKIDQQAIRRAASVGVGCLLVTDGATQVIRPASDLSLFVGAPRASAFSGRYRQDVAQAYETYIGGNPAKGLATLCDTIELIIRKVAKWAKAQGRIPRSNTLNLDTGKLYRVIKLLMKHQILHDVLLGRCLAMTGYRNTSSHHPANLEALVRRNSRLKGDFLTALQLLEDLLVASKGKRA